MFYNTPGTQTPRLPPFVCVCGTYTLSTLVYDSTIYAYKMSMSTKARSILYACNTNSSTRCAHCSLNLFRPSIWAKNGWIESGQPEQRKREKKKIVLFSMETMRIVDLYSWWHLLALVHLWHDSWTARSDRKPIHFSFSSYFAFENMGFLHFNLSTKHVIDTRQWPYEWLISSRNEG